MRGIEDGALLGANRRQQKILRRIIQKVMDLNILLYTLQFSKSVHTILSSV